MYTTKKCPNLNPSWPEFQKKAAGKVNQSPAPHREEYVFLLNFHRDHNIMMIIHELISATIREWFIRILESPPVLL